jgi:pilus assembly protein CpaF
MGEGLRSRLVARNDGIERSKSQEIQIEEIHGQTQKPSPEGESQIQGILELIQTRILSDYPLILADAREEAEKRTRLQTIISQILVKENLIVKNMDREMLSEYLVNEIVGFGPIEPLIRDENVTEIMVNGAGQVYIERAGILELTKIGFQNDRHLLAIIERIVTPTGRRIDQSSPYVDARLPDGSRVHAIIPPLSLNGPILTIRKFMRKNLQMEGLVELGSMTTEMASFLNKCVRAKMNILISGGTGSGKTTLLNALSGCIMDDEERIITIEDSAELQLNQNHVISLECRPPNIEGKGEITIRQLLRNALRMRPDRIIIGECRGSEAFDMLQAMNTGHSGSLTTIHANNVKDALSRLENMVLTAGEALPYNVIRDQIMSAIDLIIQQVRFSDGTRKVTSIATVSKTFSENSHLDVHYIYQFEVEGLDLNGGVRGDYVTCSDFMPSAELEQKIRLAGFSLSEFNKPKQNGEEVL